MIEKNASDNDCRALSNSFLVEFMPGGKYHVFVDLINKYNDELEICLRGNNQPSEAVCIYYNNHLVYKIEANGNITINFNHARYSSNYREYWKLINHTYGFNKSAVDNPRIKVSEKKNKRGHTSYYTSIGIITSKFSEDLGRNVEKIYVNCIRRMLIDSFDFLCCTDQFRATANKYAGYRGKLTQTGKKSLWLEKIRQQQLFSKIKYQKDGYFLYDLEFAQKTIDGVDDYEDALTNEPDMLAIYFDDKGLPKKFVFVEVKSTETAYSGESGMVEHLKKMKEYPTDNLPARLREAALILYQYKQIGICDIEQDVIMERFIEVANNKPEYLFIFTDKAVKKFKDDNRPEIKDFKNNARRIETMDIHIPGCKDIEFWVL